MLLSGHVLCAKGHWEVGRSAGGSRNDLDKFATNPQYLLTLTEAGTLCLFMVTQYMFYTTGKMSYYQYQTFQSKIYFALEH